jgi:hypothetical protein
MLTSLQPLCWHVNGPRGPITRLVLRTFHSLLTKSLNEESLPPTRRLLHHNTPTDMHWTTSEYFATRLDFDV